MQNPDKKAIRNKIKFVHASYLQGVVNYKLNNKEEAIEKFKDVIEKAPNLYFSVLANEYIDSISNETIIEKKEEILPIEDFEIYSQSQKYKKTIISVTLLFLFFIMIMLVITGLHFSSLEKEQENEQNTVKDAFETAYDEYEVKVGWLLPHPETEGDNIYIVETNQGIDIVTITKSKNNSYKIVKYFENIQENKIYTIRSYTNNNIETKVLFCEKADISSYCDEFDFSEIIIDGETKYFGILHEIDTQG